MTCMSDLFAPATPPPALNECVDYDEKPIPGGIVDYDEKPIPGGIAATCRKLGISHEPWQWTAEHTIDWLDELTSAVGVRGSAASNLYCLDGQQLCHLDRRQFIERVPGIGGLVHEQLQLWKSAASQSAPVDRNRSCLVSSSVDAMSVCDWLHQFEVVGRRQFGHESTVSTTTGGGGGGDSHSPTTSTDDLMEETYGEQGEQQTSRCIIQYAAPLPNWAYNVQQQPMMGQQFQIAAELPQLTITSPPYAPPYTIISSSTGNCKARAPKTQAMRPIIHTGSAHNIHLWQFLRELLDEQQSFMYHNVLRWIDRKSGTFKIENSHELARLWGVRKNRCKMNYDKLSRSLRQYYKKGILRKTGQRQRLIYQFCAPYNAMLA